jgi:hypothetical protein
MKSVLFTFLYLFLLVSLTNAQSTLNKVDFLNPPQSSKIHTWWHWMAGNITKEGITKDLESMKRQGVVEATIINVGQNFSKEVDLPRVKFNSPEWIEMFLWALKEANRLGITIGIQTIDGYCTTGGPWITPELSMKQYVWTKTTIEGGKEVITKLAQPVTMENFYSDAPVVAFQLGEKLNSFQQARPLISASKIPSGTILYDGNPKTEINLKKDDVIDVKLATDFTADKLVLFPHLPFCWDNMGKITVQFSLSASNDGTVYTKIADLEFIGVNKSISAPFPLIKAKYFRIEFVKSNFMYFNTYPIAELELLKDDELPVFTPSVSSFFEKTASVFDVNENVLDLNNKASINPIAENSIIDISKNMSTDGTLKWNAPKGHWQVIRFGYTSTGVRNDPATPEGLGLELDKMDTTALNVHIDSYAKKLIQASGKYKGNTLKFILMDSWEAQFQTWTKAFPEEFKKLRGYNIIPWIPVLCGETVGSTQLSESFLHDFRKTIADLIDQNYYKHFRDICHRNGMEFRGEVIYSNWGAYPPLDPLKSNQYVDIPMTEFWAVNDANYLGDYIPANRPAPGFPMYSALAYDKQIIGSEAYTNYAHYSEAPFDLKPFGDAAYCSGVNQLVLHSFVHQPIDKKPGFTLGKFGAHFNRNNPEWEFNQDWLTYQSRIQYVLQKGEPVVDVIFYSGDQIPQFFSKSFLNDLPYGFQASACNIDMLKNKASVTEGKISFGGRQSFPLLLLPNSTKMEFATLKQIALLVNAGAVVYGPKPMEMLSVNEIKNDGTEFRKLVAALWGESGEINYGKGKMISGKPLNKVLSQLKVLPDLTTNTNNPKEIMYIHRKLENADIYYVFNQQNKTLNREIIFRVTGKTPEIWNPEDGSVSKPAIYSVGKNQTRLPVSFKPYESKIFVFKNIPPNNFIYQVSLAGKEIFPQQQLFDTTFSIPQAVFNQGQYRFTTSSSGEYDFTTNENKIIKTKLTQPEIIDPEKLKIRIEFFPISDEAIKPVEITKLKSLTEFEDPSIKYFAGKARYSINFSVPGNFFFSNDSIVLNLGNLSATSEVILNGKLLSYVWQPNTSLVVTELLKSENNLEITVANVCRNRFIGDLIEYGSVKSLWTTSPIETILNKDMPLKPSGLIGPLKLMSFKRQCKDVDGK